MLRSAMQFEKLSTIYSALWAATARSCVKVMPHIKVSMSFNCLTIKKQNPIFPTVLKMKQTASAASSERHDPVWLLYSNIYFTYLFVCHLLITLLVMQIIWHQMVGRLVNEE
jgi:hypothetical protein